MLDTREFDMRDAILAAGTERDTVAVPGLGAVHVRGLTGAEWDEYERHCTKVTGDKAEFRNDRAKLVQMGTVDADGLPLFKAEDLDRLRKAPARVTRPLFEAIARLSGVGEDPEKN